MSLSKTENEEFVESIARDFGLDKSKACRVLAIVLEAVSCPERSVLSLPDNQAIAVHLNYCGYRWLREFFYKECIVTVGETWFGGKEILEVCPQLVI
jgi:uncharacterized Rossmann fold enzyme